MVGVVLQARLNSSRFPGKILRKIGALTIFEHCLRALKSIRVDRHIIATDLASYRVLAQYAHRYGVKIISGPEQDVLERVIIAARAFGLRTVIRATADNPFVSAPYAASALRAFFAQRCDYFHYVDIPIGCGVEICTISALMAARNHARTMYQREHVTPYIYDNPHLFHLVHAHALTHNYQHIRVTVDTPEDYHIVKQVYARSKGIDGGAPDMERIIAIYPTIHV